jgi:dTDP-4-dehydrorhamnose reductase
VNDTILLTGGTGQLGRELLRRDWPDAIAIDAPSRAELDLADAVSLAKRVREGRYAAVVNAGAYTAVDAAQAEVLPAWQINALAPAALADACAERGIPLVQISTDYVFDGNTDRPWQPADPLRPLSVYGASKAAGELAVRVSGARHAILRTAWVVSAHGRNFVKTMLRMAGERPEVGVVADQRGSPTSAQDLAMAVQAVLLRFLAEPERPSGTWHVANAGVATWHQLAEHVFAEGGRRGHPVPNLKVIATSDYPTAAPRPANSCLDTTSLERDFDIVMPPWRESVARVVGEVLERDRI